jgi:hypothetical protein
MSGGAVNVAVLLVCASPPRARAVMSSPPADAAGIGADAALLARMVPPQPPIYNEPFVRMPGLRQRPGR